MGLDHLLGSASFVQQGRSYEVNGLNKQKLQQADNVMFTVGVSQVITIAGIAGVLATKALDLDGKIPVIFTIYGGVSWILSKMASNNLVIEAETILATLRQNQNHQ